MDPSHQTDGKIENRALLLLIDGLVFHLDHIEWRHFESMRVTRYCPQELLYPQDVDLVWSTSQESRGISKMLTPINV